MKLIKNYILGYAIVSIIGATAVNAAERNSLGASPAINSNRSVSSQNFNPATMTGLSQLGTLVERKSYSNPDGSQTIRFQQMYDGLPVLGDDVIITRHNTGLLKFAHGAIVSGLDVDITSTTPKINSNRALKIAKALTRQNSPSKSSNTFQNESSILAIWLDENNKAKLVFEVSYFVDSDTPSRPYIIVDALTGKVLKNLENLQTADATGPGGNQKTGQYEYGTDFEFIDVQQSGNTCTMENSNVKTVNLNNGTSGSSAYSFTCSRNTFKPINGAFSPINDAHFFGNVVFGMYNEYINTPPLNFQLSMRVHYSNNYENAFWNGSSMTFGDGANTFYPLVSLDVSAHEVSHGFTEQNSGLVYSGKSGGLNEAFSDMAGEAAEFYMNGSNDWMVGAQIFKGNGALRFMDDPTRDGRSIDNQSDYSSGMDVHLSSGVYNKAFYLLANTAGWDTRKAFEIYARANQQYWSASTNWDQAGGGVLDAACDLGYSVEDVQSTLVAVGISSITSNPDCDVVIEPNELENNVPVTGLSASAGSDIVYTFEVPADSSNISVNMSGGSGDADLYVKFGSVPTDSSYDCRPYANGNNESCAGSNSGGTYFVRIKAYSTFSGVSIVGSYSDIVDPVEGIDETYTDISLSSGEWIYYEVDLSAGFSDLSAVISGGSGDTDLYVRQGAQPTTGSYDCRPYRNGNNETCSFDNPASDIWYVGLRGYSASSGVTLTITANP
jgi:vibriolysin